jgi:xylulokinase
MAVAVGVDLGSSGARAIAIDRDGRVLGMARAPYAGSEAWPAGRADPQSWLRALTACVNDLARDVPEARHPVGLALGGQSPTTVPLGGGLAVTVHHPAGVDAGGPEAQHLAQLEVLRAERADVEPAELWDWLLVQLGAPLAQAKWPGDPEVPGFGPVTYTGAVVGTAQSDLVVAPGTPLVAGAGDAYLSCWAAGIDRLARAIEPGGRTGGYAVGAPVGADVPGMWRFISAASNVEVIGGPVSSHGLMVEWVTRVVGRPVEETLALAQPVPPGARGVMVLPYLEGERAPRWNPSLRAHVAGIGADTGNAELVRAVLEGCAYGLRHVKSALDRAGITTESMVVGGSAARSRLWNEIKASVLGVIVEVPEISDLAAYGAALAAGAGAGWWAVPGCATSGTWPRPAMTTIDPIEEPAYDDGFARFVELGDAVEALVRAPEPQGATRP